jgi:hypothetical protein
VIKSLGVCLLLVLVGASNAFAQGIERPNRDPALVNSEQVMWLLWAEQPYYRRSVRVPVRWVYIGNGRYVAIWRRVPYVPVRQQYRGLYR